MSGSFHAGFRVVICVDRIIVFTFDSQNFRKHQIIVISREKVLTFLPSQWGIGAALLGGAAYVYSPIYRGLTIQFKV